MIYGNKKKAFYLSHQSIHHGEAERVDVLVVAAEAHPRLEQSLGVVAAGGAVELLQLALIDVLIREIDFQADDAHVGRPTVVVAAGGGMPVGRPVAVARVDAIVVRGAGFGRHFLTHRGQSKGMGLPLKIKEIALHCIHRIWQRPNETHYATPLGMIHEWMKCTALDACGTKHVQYPPEDFIPASRRTPDYVTRHRDGNVQESWRSEFVQSLNTYQQMLFLILSQ